MRTSKFVQPSGSDEGSIAILLRNSPSDCGADDPTLDRPGPGGYPGRVIPCGTSASYQRSAIQGAAAWPHLEGWGQHGRL